MSEEKPEKEREWGREESSSVFCFFPFVVTADVNRREQL
jgi:hypothetical protein